MQCGATVCSEVACESGVAFDWHCVHVLEDCFCFDVDFDAGDVCVTLAATGIFWLAPVLAALDVYKSRFPSRMMRSVVCTKLFTLIRRQLISLIIYTHATTTTTTVKINKHFHFLFCILNERITVD